MVDPVNIAVIVNLEAPRNIKQLCTTLGHTRYYKKFIKAYVQITVPVEKLLKKDMTFCCDEECQRNLDVLKEKMVTAPILVFLDWKKELHVHVDASCIALGVVLTQAGEGKMDHLIAFASRKLLKAEKNYSVDEWHYLLGGHLKMYTDHSPLKYLVKNPVLGENIFIWLLLFQEYDFEFNVNPRI